MSGQAGVRGTAPEHASDQAPEQVPHQPEQAPGRDGDSRPWTIAEVAREFGVTHRTVRYYEAQGLITPQRRGTQRLYRARDRVRLALILRGRRLGFELAEIATIIDMYDHDGGEQSQLRYLLDQIAVRRQQLEQRRHDIEVTLAELDEVERRCRAALPAGLSVRAGLSAGPHRS